MRSLFAVGLLSVVLAGCATSDTPVAKNEAELAPQAIGVPFLGMIPVRPAERAAPAKAAEARPVTPGELAKNVPLDFDPIYFEVDEARLEPNEAESVASLANWMKENPRARLKIEGFTDESGTKAHNYRLGARRASLIKEALVGRGISARRLELINHGGEPAERKTTVSLLTQE
jgi:outer membrane protein OmpA-like peptidoglycan-associated protein